MVSKLGSAAMLLPCAAHCPSVVARTAAVVRGAIAGASALLAPPLSGKRTAICRAELPPNSELASQQTVHLCNGVVAEQGGVRCLRPLPCPGRLPEAAVFTARSATCA